ncbi:MAG: ABC transporter ATP-binding protein [Desulfobacteraceae bacterium]|nr:ABC transporter ATP-binding protein [Desulfobacteraceae bacterium]
MYELKNVAYAYGSKAVLSDVCLRFDSGCFYGVIGPNGSGKTTLLDLLAGHRRASQGTIAFKKKKLHDYSRQALARLISLVPQQFAITFPYTCKEIVMMGRHPHIPRFARPGVEDYSIVEKVLEQTRLNGFENRLVSQLSGGEGQRVVFARCLAQQTQVLLLDEATSNLDMHHSLDLLDLAAGRVKQGATVIAVLQDINLAAMYCQQLVCMKDGQVLACGPSADVLTAQMLKTVFNVQARVEYNHFSQSRQIVFQRRAGHEN